MIMIGGEQVSIDFDYLLLLDQENIHICSEIDNEEDILYLCMNCGRDIGALNPRQLCGKVACLMDDEEEEENTPALGEETTI